MTLLKNNIPAWLNMMALGVLSIILYAGCQSKGLASDTPQSQTVSAVSNEWNDYWYAGKAEVNSYRLDQSRYGQDRTGTSVLVFVTEDFSKSKHVKLDNPGSNSADKVSVLKSNIIRKFNTGIYDYSMMSSVFTPVSLDKFPNTLKVTTTSQEWCGHSWTQYDLQDQGFKIEGRSYFESEGDQTVVLKSGILEDALWNRIRINPENVPTGKLKIIPGSFFSRLDHVAAKVETATLNKKIQTSTTVFELDYSSIDRTLEITISNDFPYKIMGWSESSGRGTTSGTLLKTLNIPYWNMNGNQFESYRDTLMLH